jgi:hypothetical protein
MTNEQAKAMAREMIGDGETPNKFFVTSSPYYMVSDESGDIVESELLDGFDHNYSETKVFDTLEDAETYYNEVHLDIYEGVGSVTIEDRLTGQIKEKSLEKIVRVEYMFRETDDTKLFGYKK